LNWYHFADNVLLTHNIVEKPMDIRIHKVLPELEEAVIRAAAKGYFRQGWQCDDAVPLLVY
jgi:hypothetical protein